MHSISVGLMFLSFIFSPSMRADPIDDYWRVQPGELGSKEVSDAQILAAIARFQELVNRTYKNTIHQISSAAQVTNEDKVTLNAAAHDIGMGQPGESIRYKQFFHRLNTRLIEEYVRVNERLKIIFNAIAELQKYQVGAAARSPMFVTELKAVSMFPISRFSSIMTGTLFASPSDSSIEYDKKAAALWIDHPNDFRRFLLHGIERAEDKFYQASKAPKVLNLARMQPLLPSQIVQDHDPREVAKRSVSTIKTTAALVLLSLGLSAGAVLSEKYLPPEHEKLLTNFFRISGMAMALPTCVVLLSGLRRAKQDADRSPLTPTLPND